MFVPLHDANSLKHIKLQVVTISIIAINFAIFLTTMLSGDRFIESAVYGLGYIPSVVFDNAELPPELVLVPENATYITYAFLHGDLLHIAGNMVFLWVFGDNIEDALGHVRFLVFYLACAVAGALLHGIAAPSSQVPLIGASGAVAGIVSAYLMLHPRVKVWVLAFGRVPVRVPAFFALAFWILFQFFMFATAGDDEVSWAAHIGGILAGVVLVTVLRRSGVPLFDREIVTPAAVEVEQESNVRPRVVPAPRWGRQ